MDGERGNGGMGKRLGALLGKKSIACLELIQGPPDRPRETEAA